MNQFGCTSHTLDGVLVQGAGAGLNRMLGGDRGKLRARLPTDGRLATGDGADR